MITTIIMTLMMITIRILTAQAAGASPAIQTLIVPAENFVYLLLQLPIPVQAPLPLAMLL
jgi:hypothetical protein